MFATKRHATLTYADASGLSRTFTDVGDVSIGPIGGEQRDIVAVLNRGSFAGWVHGDDVPIDVSFTINLKGEALTSASAARDLDAIRFTGTWAAGTTTNQGGFGPKCGTLTYTISVNGVTTSIPIERCWLKVNLAESTPTTLSVTGQGYLGTIS